MDTTLVAAVIGAIATLSAVWFSHYLNMRGRVEEKENVNDPKHLSLQVKGESNLPVSKTEFTSVAQLGEEQIGQYENLKLSSISKHVNANSGNEQRIKVLIEDIESYVNSINTKNEKRMESVGRFIRPYIIGFLFFLLVMTLGEIYESYATFFLPIYLSGTPIFSVVLDFVFHIFANIIVQPALVIVVVFLLAYIFLLVPLEFLLKINKHTSTRKYFTNELKINNLDRHSLLHLRDTLKTSGLDDEVKKITTTVIANNLQESVSSASVS